MRWARAVASAVALAVGASAPLFSPAFAQEAPAAIEPFQSPVLTINQQNLFEDSAFGKASLARLEAASRDLQAEIRKIESDLEIEERLLTERRTGLAPSEFLPLARAFDEKVEKIRNAWANKDKDLKQQRETDRRTFFEGAVPVLAELMREMGAVILIDQSTVILGLDRVDITQQAILVLDAQLAEFPVSGSDPSPADGTPPAEGQNAPANP